MTNKWSNFVFAQPTNLGNFSEEDHSLPQYIEIHSRSQESQRKHMINKTQEVRGDEEFEDDSNYGKSAKEKGKNANQIQKP